MNPNLPDQIRFFLWDQMAFRGHWLLPVLLVSTLAGCWLWWRDSPGRPRWLAWTVYGVFAVMIWAEVAAMRTVFEPSVAEDAGELRRTDSFVGKQLPQLVWHQQDGRFPRGLSRPRALDHLPM